MAIRLTGDLKKEYETLFNRLAVRSEHQADVELIQRRITLDANKKRYQEVEAAANVPWFVVATIHNLESSGRFSRHLHNGDRLTARTKRVPAGHPKSGHPPFSWSESAIDALKLKKLHRWKDWSVAGIAFVLEGYNGWGYRKHHPHVKSPYLWSFSNIYSSGKYTRDRFFDPDFVSDQCGGMVLLKHLVETDASVRKRLSMPPAPPKDDDHAAPTPHQQDGEDDWPKNPPKFPNRYFRKGDSGPQIKRIQKRLAEMGCDPGTKDGSFGQTTHFALLLFQARSADLSGIPLEIDAVVGPKTWGALFGPNSLRDVDDPDDKLPFPRVPQPSKLSDAVLEIAVGEIGVMEVPRGSNRGPRVTEYQDSVSSGLHGQPWCMCFVYWCFKQAAEQTSQQNRVPKTGHVLTCWSRTRKLSRPVKFITAKQARENPSLIEPGMVFFIRTSRARATGHTGIVIANLNGLLETVEGNTNNGGSREGIGVFRRKKRRISGINVGFASYD